MPIRSTGHGDRGSGSLSKLSRPQFFAGGSDSLASSDSSDSPNSLSARASLPGERESSQTSAEVLADGKSYSYRPGYKPATNSSHNLRGGEAERNEHCKDSPFNASDSLQNYRQQQETGIRLLGWINDPSVSCPITTSRSTFRGLISQKWDLLEQPGGLPANYTQSTFLPPSVPGAVGSQLRQNSYRWTSIKKAPPHQPLDVCWWSGRTAQGVVFLEDVNRPEGSQFPFISELTKAIYEKDFDIDTLRYVFVTDIANPVTRGFIIGVLWPENTENPRVIASHTPEFQVLLGTPIGKIVAYLTLNAFTRGTKRISQIVLWHDDQASPHLRFDIE